MGRAGSWYLAIKHPNLSAAILPICGFASLCYADSITHVQVWAFHGAADNAISPQFSQDMVNAAPGPMQTAPATGRQIPPVIYPSSRLMVRWLGAQTVSSAPSA
jgi:hypothetical protein